MDHDQIIDLGNAAEVILTNPMFNQICEQFEEDTVHKMVQTKPTQSAEREAIYATLVGARELLGFMQNFVQERNKLLKPNEAPVDASDDATVLDIYRE
jgi:hypothetical protein